MSPELLDPLAVEFWARVLASIVCGGIIGLERQLRGKPAGIRTCIMICLGTQFFVILGSSFAPQEADPSRVLGQIVTGIGFLGAGVILTREGLVVGVTSAAVIWLLAAVGAMIGLGHLSAALTVSTVAVVVLVGVEKLEKTSRALRRGVHAWRTALGGASAEDGGAAEGPFAGRERRSGVDRRHPTGGGE